MPARDEQGDRTYMPTPLRLEDARRQGRVARSSDLSAVVVTLAALCATAILGGTLLEGMRELVAACLDFSQAHPGAESPASAVGDAAGAIWAVLIPAAGICGVAAAAAVLVNVVQTRGLVAPRRVSPQWQRLCLTEGLSRLFGARSLVRGVLAVAKLAVVAAVAWTTLSQAWPRMLSAAGGDGEAILSAASSLVWRMGLRVAAVLLVLACADYLYQRWQHVRDLKMTRRQWLDDMRRMEGDPRRRRRRRLVAGAARDVSATVGVAGAAGEQT